MTTLTLILARALSYGANLSPRFGGLTREHPRPNRVWRGKPHRALR